MLGHSVHQPAGRRKAVANDAPMCTLYKKVFPAILKLACDVDQVSKVIKLYYL